MPDYSFFLSYASADRIPMGREEEKTNPRDFVRVFYDDLHAEMIKRGYPDGGFFDKKGVQGKWEPDLREALACSRILVPLYSRNYFKGPYCGKEWEIFNLRFAENVKNKYPDVTFPKVTLPVCWRPVGLPAVVKDFQVDYESYPAIYTNGLEYMMERTRHADDYRDFLWTFANKLADLADSQGKPKVRDVPEFDTLIPSFPGNNRPGLTFVRYVFATGMRNDMSNLRKTIAGYPEYRDRSDWRPGLPDTQPIEQIAGAPAKAQLKEYEMLELPSQGLMDRLLEARRLNNVIVIIVDPWSVRLPALHQFLKALDDEAFPNSAVLVNWNRQDSELTRETKDLEDLLKGYFLGRKVRKEFFRDPVESPDGIAQALTEAFREVQARLIELGKIPSAGPEGASGKALVLGN